jgi:hypothetical protein
LGAAAQYWAGFEAAVAQGRLIVTISNLADGVDEAKRLSSTHTLTEGHRGFDILHVASALRMNATHFLTFDGNQKNSLRQKVGSCLYDEGFPSATIDLAGAPWPFSGYDGEIFLRPELTTFLRRRLRGPG